MSPPDIPAGPLDRKLCQVGGVNQNYVSSGGTLYHIQVEDRGPVLDRISETEVRRVNMIVYANYGEPNAQIVYGRDHDYPDVRTHAHNTFIKSRIADLAAEARRLVEETEQRHVTRIKGLIREYYVTKSETIKKEFEDANAAFPFLFSRAWMQLKRERPNPGIGAPGAVGLDSDQPSSVGRSEIDEHAAEIERIIATLEDDLKRLKAEGKADDILVQTCRKLVARARETLSERAGSGFTARRLEMTRKSLTTTLRQVKSRLKA